MSTTLFFSNPIRPILDKFSVLVPGLTGVQKMRIVVDTALNTGPAEFSNLGDIAMLQAGMTRLRRLWPSAIIEVLTDSPTDLRKFCPDATPLPRAGRDFWLRETSVLGRFQKVLPRTLVSGLGHVMRRVRLAFPHTFKLLAHARLALRDGEGVRLDVDAFLDALTHADLFVVCGAGGFSDNSLAWNISTLDTIEEAIARKVPVVLFGQGMGPLTDARFKERARKVLPRVSLLSLRGGRGEEALARSLGVASEKITTTGDEAIEIAYRSNGKPGHAVGLNLRVASYSKIDSTMIENLRPVLHAFARRHNVPLIPVPIAFHSCANDHLTIQELLKGFDDHSRGGIELDTPLKVINQISRCKVLVTGAYHGAVFALSQGIPVVGLSASEDYTVKFLGLQDQFGPGCGLVMLDRADAQDSLAMAMEKAWNSAEALRRPLLEAARRQIDLSEEVYLRVREGLAGSSNSTESVAASCQ